MFLLLLGRCTGIHTCRCSLVLLVCNDLFVRVLDHSVASSKSRRGKKVLYVRTYALLSGDKSTRQVPCVVGRGEKEDFSSALGPRMDVSYEGEINGGG